MQEREPTFLPQDMHETNFQEPVGAQQQFPSQAESAAKQWEYDTTDILDKVREVFGGEVWDDEKKDYVKKREALCNQKGVDFVMRYLGCYMQKITFLSNFTPIEVREILQVTMADVICELRHNYRIFGIDKYALSSFVNLLRLMMMASIKKAEGDRERIHKGRITTRKENINRTEYGEERGIRGALRGGGLFG